MGKIKDVDLEPRIDGLEFYIVAYRELESCRNSGMDVGPIPFTAILRYWEKFPTEDFEEFLYLIRQMDDTYLKLESNKSKARDESKG